MPRSQVFVQLGRRDRQITGRGDNPVAAHNDRPVMERCIFFKYIDEQLAGDDRVDLDSGAHIFEERCRLFDHNQGSCLHPSHFDAGAEQFVDCPVRKTALLGLGRFHAENGAQEISASQFLHGLAQFRLKNDHKCCDGDTRDVLEDPQNCGHVKDSCKNGHCYHYSNSLHQLPGSRVFHPHQDVICQICYNQDFDNICPPYIGYSKPRYEVTK